MNRNPQLGNPRHIGIIMDGNGRWAQRRHLPRSFGHKQGLDTVKHIVKCASDLGIPFLSLYAFSTENWKRAQDEVSFLMDLITRHLKGEFNFYRENQIRVIHSGSLAGLPNSVAEELRQVCQDTRLFTGLTVNLAINYGGRDDILRGLRALVSDLVDEGADAESLQENLAEMDECSFAKWLDAPDLPDLDLIIRTGGEQRISNFLLWKSAYAELVFSDKLWPDWQEPDLQIALADYRQRERRYGAVNQELAAV